VNLDLDDLERRLYYDHGTATEVRIDPQWTHNEGRALLAEVRRLRRAVVRGTCRPTAEETGLSNSGMRSSRARLGRFRCEAYFFPPRFFFRRFGLCAGILPERGDLQGERSMKPRRRVVVVLEVESEDTLRNLRDAEEWGKKR